ncbi:HET-domain-containing protein [Xylariaceae sp. AK1471]|nr:HET-domain-containing protein [Xylariaceae sp. AK1471]
MHLFTCLLFLRVVHMMLCSQCETLCSLVKPGEDIDVAHYDTSLDLDLSARSGCRLCQVLSRARFEKSTDPHTSHKIRTKLIRDAGIQLSLTLSPGQGPCPTPQDKANAIITYVIFESYGLPSRLVSVLLADDFDNTNTGSESAFRLSAAWLNECLLTHVRCNPVSADVEPPLPHRVLDVGSADDPYVYLVDTRTTLLTGRYTTLSHCWGGGSPIMTTRDNIASHEEGIRCSDLPPTFRDAVHTTRNLGCRYLWIDSLCIVQNDREDWKAEATLMCQYYKHSLVTIAAADGSDSSAGLFRERSGYGYLPCPLRLGSGGETQGRQVYAFTNSLSSDLKRSSLSDSYRPNHLDTRAWVFQEQALSSRTLSYARDSMSWRCQEAVFDDRPPYYKDIGRFINEPYSTNVIPGGRDPRTMAAMIARLQRDWLLTPSVPTLPNGFITNCANSEAKHSHTRGTPCFSPEDEFIIHWGNMVSEYTRRGLTYQTDKLIAIQGIADALISTHNRADSTSPKNKHLVYHAGTWAQTNRSTVLSLLWSVSFPGKKKNSIRNHEENSGEDERPRLDIASSWSWATTTYEVRWPGHLLHRLEPRLEVRQVVSGGMEAGELLVEANVKAAFLSRRIVPGQPAVLCAIYKWTDKDGPASDSTEAEERAVPTLLQGLPLAVDGSKAPDYVSLDEQLEIGGGEPWAVWLAEVAVGEVHSRVNMRQVHCFVLRKLTNEWEVKNHVKYMVCKRVGYCVFDEAKWSNGSESDMRRVGLYIV